METAVGALLSVSRTCPTVLMHEDSASVNSMSGVRGQFCAMRPAGMAPTAECHPRVLLLRAQMAALHLLAHPSTFLICNRK